MGYGEDTQIQDSFMFQALVQRLLAKILGEYVQNFSAENLKIGIWSGQVVLSNLVLKKSVIRRLNLPLRVLYSRLGTVRMTIPWKSLTSSKIEVLLQGLELVVAQVPASQWECRDARIIQKRKLQVQAMAEGLLAGWAARAEKQGSKQQKDDGYFSKLVVKIVDNLQVTIRDIHIRYEDTITKTFAFGVTLEELKLYTVNAKGEPEYVDRSKPEYADQPLRKRLEMYNVGIYWNEKAQLFNESNYQFKMTETIARRGKPLAHNYLILMTSQAQLLQREPGKQWTHAEIDLQVALEDISMQVTNSQLQQIVGLAERLQAYTRKLRDANRAKLSPEEAEANRNAFATLFPTYYDGWGKNMCLQDMTKLQSILQKMQVQELSSGIQTFLQGRQRQRIIKQRKQKSKGWWFGKPKELTQQELTEIEGYLNNNFAKEHKLVKRPEDYYYIRVGLSLKKLEVGIANTLAIIKEGIQANIEDLGVQFCLREGGYGLQVSLENISVDMFKQIGVQPRQRTPVLYKLHQRTSQVQNSYLKMAVTGNPLHKKHLNTDIKLVTSELLLKFDPKIITIATEFADLKLSSEYREAAIEKFGEIKEATTSAVSESMQKPSKLKIGVDVAISSMTVVLPFSPHKQDGDCWGVNLGSIRLSSDEETLLRTEVVEGKPLDVFHLELAAFSFRHYSSPQQLTHMLVTGAPYSRPAYALLDNLDFRLRVQVFAFATDSQPRLSLVATLPAISVNLNSFTYSSVLRLGEAFVTQPKEHLSRQTARIEQKKEIQKRSVKIGFVYIKGRLTQVWQKYVAIMSENYIYLYLNKNDKDYYAYYYIKGAKLTRFSDPLDTQKQFLFKISNKVNQVVFGFDKQDQIDDWVAKINSLNQQKQAAVAVSPPSSPAVVFHKKHNQLNLQVAAEIQSIAIKVFTTQSLTDRVISLQFASLSAKMMLHQSKKRIQLHLLSVSLSDTIQSYRNKALSHFLQTINGEQQSLIAITVEQLNKDHPDFDHTDSAIHVSFGTLVCNYKCETVQALMGFFVPPSPPPQEAVQSPINSNSTEIDLTNAVSLTNISQGEENYSLKLYLQMKEISLTMVNSKTKTVLGRLGIADLKLYMGMSQKRLVLEGSQRDLYYIDTTNHPYTLTEEQESYEQFQKYILTANIGSEKNMLQFNIQTLKAPNEYGKTLLVDVRLANLTTYFSLQPVLRLITYLTSQMLPSFQAQSKEPKPIPPKDTKPEPTTMDLKVQLSNISVFVETARQVQREKQEYMQLNIAAITVSNQAAYRDYVRGNKPIILVQTYNVNLYALSIAVHYFDAQMKQHRYKLTNNMDISLSTDLIANPEYYKKELPQDFDNGMRVKCTMTPFFMSINHHDYSFIMKCLNWAISYNDGLDTVLFDPAPNAPPPQIDPQQKQQKDPFYLTLSMECISLFVTQEDIPIAFLEQTDLGVYFSTNNDGMVTKVTMGQLYGTSIEHDRQTGKLKERGIFNSLGYTAEHSVQDVRDLQSYMKVFDRRSGMGTGQQFLQFALSMDEKAMNIDINMSEICIDADVRLLLVLSTLANTDQIYIKGPTPPRQTSVSQKEIQGEKPAAPPSSPAKRMSLLLNLGKFVTCVSDSNKSKFAFIEGAVCFSMINDGEKTIQQLQELRGEESLQHSIMGATLKGLTLYFSRIKNGKTVSRRQFLQPMTIQFDQKRFYHMQKEIHMLQTDIRVKTTELVLTASLRDMLNVNTILQDSLKTMAEFNKDQAQTKTKIEQSLQQQRISQVDEMAIQRELQKIEQKMEKEIQNKMKIIGSVGAMHFQIVNDCGRNFMPMLRLMVEESEPAMQQVLVTTEIIIVPILSLEFFNPRSSRWEPIIQPFKAALGMTTISLNKQQSTSITLKTGSLQEETSSLKVNLSTQLMSTLMAAKEALSAQQASLEKKEEEQDAEGKDIEVSPFIFHNITNEKIYILREKEEFLLPPLFKGPVRLPNDRQIHFRLCQHVMKLSTDHYGVMRLADSGFFIKFDSQRLNKVIKFMPQLIIRNKLRQAVTIRRWGREESTLKVEKGNAVPLDGVQFFAVSISGTSYTERMAVGSVKLVGFMLAEKKNFLILLRYKQRAGRFAVLELLPPFVVYNCLPKPLNLQFLQKAKLKSTIAVPAQQAYSIFTAQDVNSLQVRANTTGFTWSKKFKFIPNQQGEGQLQLGDEDDFRTVLTYRFIREHSGQYLLTIYCRKFIVNELSDKLLVYGNGQAEQREGKRDDFTLVGGQKHQVDTYDEKIILLGEEIGNKLRVCGAHSQVDFATPIAVGGLGQSQARIVVDRQRAGQRKSLFSVIGVEISAVRMSKYCQVFSKKIVLRSKAIFVNSTKRNFSIKEEAATASTFRSEAGTRKSLVFGLPEIEGQQPTYSLSSEGMKSSRSLVLPTQGTVHFKLAGQEQGTREAYFKIVVKQVGCYSFYQLTEITAQDFPYELIVKTSRLRVRIPIFKRIVVVGEECRFIGEQFGSGETGEQLQIWIGHSDSEEQVCVRVCPDDLKFKQKHLLRFSKGNLQGSLAVKVEVTIRDKQRAIVIDEQIRLEEPQEIQESAISLQLAEIVLSISQNSEAVQVPYESLVLTLRRLQLIKLETDKRVQYQVKLGFLQIDQAYPHVIASPVVLTPHRFAEYTRDVDPKAVFNFTVVLSKEFVRNTFISEVSVDLGDLVATFSADFLALATTISKEFAEVANYRQESYLVQRKEEEWQGIQVPPQGKAVFVKCIRIAPFVVDLSAELNLKKLNLQNNILLTTVLSTVGVMVSNIDSAPISMTGIQIDDCIDSMDSITRRLVAHYKATCVSQFYKVVGSLNIIGNPLSLFRNISTGVKDLKDKPAKGFVNGPAQFGLGIVQGTGSLVAHSVGGAFNSIAKVTGTVSSGLATLAFDREFEQHREKERMKKPQNVIQGVAKGGKAIFYGFKEGITGVFMQPIENARKEGAVGFMKGAAKGLAGLVVKPVTGIIDFASKTTQGIKNNALMFEDKARDQRMRHPRVFYSQCFILKEYSPRDSQLFAILKKVDNQQAFPNPVFVDAFQTDKEKHFLILLLSGVAYLDGEGRKLKWAIDYSQLELENAGKKLVFKKGGKKGSFFHNYQVEMQADDARNIVAQLIRSQQKDRLAQ